MFWYFVFVLSSFSYSINIRDSLSSVHAALGHNFQLLLLYIVNHVAQVIIQIKNLLITIRCSKIFTIVILSDPLTACIILR